MRQCHLTHQGNLPALPSREEIIPQHHYEAQALITTMHPCTHHLNLIISQAVSIKSPKTTYILYVTSLNECECSNTNESAEKCEHGSKMHERNKYLTHTTTRDIRYKNDIRNGRP